MASKFSFDKNKQIVGKLGICNKKKDFYTSLILSEDERLLLTEMTKATNESLIYRATRDGFSSEAFHLKCDGIPNTVTIIKTNSNYVFGGFTAAIWSSDKTLEADPCAFIFSLRRHGISNSQKFLISQTNSAIYRHLDYGPVFGVSDILIIDKSDINTGSCTFFGHSYELPLAYCRRNEETNKYLAGSYNNWLTTEIEVYRINNS